MSHAFSLMEFQPMHKIELYQPEKHKEELMIWAKQWNWHPEVLEILPTTGLIIEGICATFLYETNSKTCFMEGFICNKEISKEDRDLYLDQIVEALFALAKEKGYKYMQGNTRYKAVLDRSIKLGFKQSPYTYSAVYKRL